MALAGKAATPDVTFALQETKVRGIHLSAEALRRPGFRAAISESGRGYNRCCLLSKLPLEDVKGSAWALLLQADIAVRRPWKCRKAH